MMKLIIGGAYQGKRHYALERYGDEEMVVNFHLQVLEWLKQEVDPVLQLQAQLSDYQNKVIVCDDISCGVVPVDPLMRAWREAMGHTLAVLVKESEEVVRVFCGIGMQLK